jgi:hypothetical protein
MKLMNNIKYTILFGLVLLTGCKKDWLNLNPVAQPTEVSFFSTQAGADQAVTATYAALLPYEVMDIYYTIDFGSVGSDDAEVGGNSTTDQPDVQNINHMTQTPAQCTRFGDFWGYMYKGIRMANTAIYYIDYIKNNKTDPNADTTVLNRLKGEALFLRGFYHFCLAQVYGGVVLEDQYVGVKNYSTTPRSTLVQTYTFIENDFQNAISLLDNMTSKINNPNVGRANKIAAQAYLVKALVYESSYAKNYPGDSRFVGLQQKWHQANTLAKEIINFSSQNPTILSLLGSNGERYSSWWVLKSTTDTTIGGFREEFTAPTPGYPDGDNSVESIFEIQEINDGLGWAEGHGSYITTYTQPKYVVGISSVTGWGWNCPSQYLAAAFGNNDSRESGLSSTSYDGSLDPRFATTIARDGDTMLTIGDKRPFKLAWRKIICIDSTGAHKGSSTGMYSRKYELNPNEGQELISQAEASNMNIRLFRYADLLLLAAEAAYWDNDQASAMNYVNQVRSRARVSGNTGYPQNLTAITFQDIMHERRLELAMEGHRFFDLVRWNEAQHFITGCQRGLEDPSYKWTVTFTSNKNEFFPIPADQIQISDLQQNENY